MRQTCKAQYRGYLVIDQAYKRLTFFNFPEDATKTLVLRETQILN